jgi:ribosomal peptide maturation radical SAM protein 1
MPWAIFNRPSIQLGSLKSYLEQAGDIRVDTYHPYLEVAREIGVTAYTTLSETGWAGEALFSALLFAGKDIDPEAVFQDSLDGKGKQLPSYSTLISGLQTACDKWLASIDWDDYLAVGFSCCFNQLLASLYIAARLKKLNIKLPIVLGGSSCGGALGTSLLTHFPQVDYIIDGEGEGPLQALCLYLGGEAPALPDRVLSRHIKNNARTIPEITDLNTLPLPDYAAYFQQIKKVFPTLPFIPTLPVEFSRGCWWHKCTFCNLNLQWKKYRWKRAETMISEIDRLTTTYQCLDFSFTDNALPPKEADAFFTAMDKRCTDLQFFAEIRGITQPERLALYRRGGLNTIQVGIESLSGSLLERMQKGCTVIDNIAVLKHCMASDIRLEGNLIIEFPASSSAEVAETLENLDFVLPFHPLSPASFFLGFGSPIHQTPAQYGIQAVLPHRKNRALFPSEYHQSLELLIRDFRGDRTLQRRQWQPVRKKIAAWQAFHDGRKSRTVSPLSYRDGGSFIIIRQEQITGSPLHHRLRGLSREIYLFCDTIRTIDEINEQFPALKLKAIRAFIHDLHEKRIMFTDQKKVLALAVRQK